ISVHVIAGDTISGEPIPKKTIRTAQPSRSLDSGVYAFTLAAVTTTVCAGLLVWPLVGTKAVDLIFLTAVVAVAVRHGVWPSLAASFMLAICYNFFFTEPYYSLMINNPTDAVAVVFFFVV